MGLAHSPQWESRRNAVSGSRHRYWRAVLHRFETAQPGQRTRACRRPGSEFLALDPRRTAEGRLADGGCGSRQDEAKPLELPTALPVVLSTRGRLAQILDHRL